MEWNSKPELQNKGKPTLKSVEHVNTINESGVFFEKEVFRCLSQNDEKEVEAILQRLDEKLTHEQETWLDVGCELNLLKPHVKRGKLAEWVKRIYGLEPRSAQQRMKAASVFKGKLDVVSVLPPQTLIALSRDDAEFMRPTIIGMLEAGAQLTHDDVIEIMNGGPLAKTRHHGQPDGASSIAALILGDGKPDYIVLLEKLERINAKALLKALIAHANGLNERATSSETQKKQPDDRTALH